MTEEILASTNPELNLSSNCLPKPFSPETMSR